MINNEQFHEHMKTQAMLEQEAKLRMRRFINEIIDDKKNGATNAVTLSDLIFQAASTPNFAVQTIGYISGRMGVVHPDCCEGCGLPQCEHIENSAPSIKTPVTESKEEEVRSSSDDVAVEETESLAVDTYDFDLKVFNLTEIPDSGGMVRCNGCGKEYISLNDRMLRVPGVGGCEGCIEKNKWG